MAATSECGVNEANATHARLDASVRGLVQGVGFRWFVRRKASALGLTGWTANQSDGSVRVVVEGPSESLEEMESVLREGPSGAVVDRVDARKLPATGEFKAFDIRSGSHRGD